MPRLTADMHSELTDYVISLLHKNKIVTAMDVLKGDPNQLAKITNIGRCFIEIK